MRILEIIPQLSSGGAERFVVDLCNELSISNDVTLLVFHNLEQYGFYANELSDKVRIISLNKKKGVSFLLFRKIYSIIRTLKPNVVHLHLSSIIYVSLSILLFRTPKYFMTIHNDAEKEAEGVLGTMVRKFFFKNGLMVPVTISKQSFKSFVKYYDMSTVPMIYNGRKVCVDSAIPETVINEFKQYKKAASTKVIINIARINVVKRQPMLARIAKRLYEEGADIALLMIGNPRDAKIMGEIDLEKAPNTYVLGERSNPIDFLRLADAFCLGSSYEGLPISLIEALGAGTIPICTPVGGIVDVITDGENGYLASDLSEDAMYDAFKRFLHAPSSDIMRMKMKVIVSYASYSMEKCAAEYLRLFAERVGE